MSDSDSSGVLLSQSSVPFGPARLPVASAVLPRRQHCPTRPRRRLKHSALSDRGPFRGRRGRCAAGCAEEGGEEAGHEEEDSPEEENQEEGLEERQGPQRPAPRHPLTRAHSLVWSSRAEEEAVREEEDGGEEENSAEEEEEEGLREQGLREQGAPPHLSPAASPSLRPEAILKSTHCVQSTAKAAVKKYELDGQIKERPEDVSG